MKKPGTHPRGKEKITKNDEGRASTLVLTIDKRRHDSHLELIGNVLLHAQVTDCIFFRGHWFVIHPEDGRLIDLDADRPPSDPRGKKKGTGTTPAKPKKETQT